jgi:hypothetical protein
MKKILLGIMTVVLGGAYLQAENLLKNSDYQELSSARLPLEWRAYSDGQDISLETKDLPEGCKAALKVEIKKEAKNNGSITQDVKGVPADSQLVLTGKFKSSVSDIAYVLIKLKDGKKTLKRIKSKARSGKEWTEVKMEFSSLSASVVSVQLRFSQDAKSQGASIYFADFKLDMKK